MSEGVRSPVWYAAEARAVAAKQISFMHVGALRRTRDYEEDLRSSFEALGMSVSVQRVEGPEFTLSEVGGADVLILTGLENAITAGAAAPVLETLRPQVGELAAGGTKVLLTATCPVPWFPASLGSSMLADAAGVRCQRLSEEQLAAISADFDARHSTTAIGKSGGLPGLLEDFLFVNAMDASNSERIRQSQALTRARLDAAIAEMDHACLAVLEEVALRLHHELLEDALAPESTMQALLDAGLCRAGDSAGVIRIFEPDWEAQARDALEQAISAVTRPPKDWIQVAEDLFSFERVVRRALTLRLKEEHGDDWCTMGLGPMADSVFSLAVADGFVAVASADEIANPLDYLLMDELLDLAMEKSTSTPLLGLNTARWRILKGQLIPIRNRFAHMRMPQPRDAATVRVALKSLRP